MTRPRLTQAQSEPLLKVVDYQRDKGKELSFTHYADGKIRPSMAVSGEPIPDLGAQEVARVSPLIFVVWQQSGYVTPKERSSVSNATVRDFVLTQEALDYAKHMHRPKLVRGLIDLLRTWQSDLRTAILAVVVTVVTTLILKKMGL